MSVKSLKKMSSKRKKPQVDNAQAEVMFELGLEAFWNSPLNPATMLDISTWSLENQAPVVPKYLPRAFLQRLWLLSPEARSPSCIPPSDTPAEESFYNLGEESQGAVNPLDLVTAVYLSADSFLQQEMTMRMVQCQFAVPLVLPSIITQQHPSCFLLWPMRGVVSQWRPHSLANTSRVLEGDLASTEMTMVACVKLGRCGISKSRALSRVIGGLKPLTETFLHREMEGGQLHRTLSNGLIELGWYLPTGNPDSDIFPVPVVISNLRGEASAHEKCVNLMCRTSSAMVVFCGNLREKEKSLLTKWKGMTRKLILIDLSDPTDEENEKRTVEFVAQSLEEMVGLPHGSVLYGGAINEEELAYRLHETLTYLLPEKLEPVTLEAAAKIAEELGLNIDEGPSCKKAMALANQVLTGLEEGSAQFREKQLPLQGALWNQLGEMEKDESKQRKAGENIDQLLLKEKRNILLKLSSYRMTTAMKVFTDSLFTTDKTERMYFLSWMKLRLRSVQMRKQHCLQEPSINQQEKIDQLHQGPGKVVINEKDDDCENQIKSETGTNYDSDDDSFCTFLSVEDLRWEEDMAVEQLPHEHNTVGIGQQLSKQQSEKELDLKYTEPLDMALENEEEPYNYEDLSSDTENSMGQTDPNGQEQLNPLLSDAVQDALQPSDEMSTERNLKLESPQGETWGPMLLGVPETENIEQLGIKQTKREQRKLDSTSEQQTKKNLKSTEKDNIGEELHDNQGIFKEQTVHSQIPMHQQSSEFRPNRISVLNCPGQPEGLQQKPDDSDTNASKNNITDLHYSTENQATLGSFAEHHFEPDPFSLGLEHFFREMGLIFELTHISPGSGSHNVLRLPSVAADLLFYGIPLELMDGDASNIPSCWLGSVMAEIKRRLPQEGVKVRVLTNFGISCSRNSEVLSGLFGVNFPQGGRRSTRGVYMLALSLPNELREDTECDFLLIVDVEGLFSPGLNNKRDTLIHDNEMATLATGLSDVLMYNISSCGDSEFETNLNVIVNALLRTEVCGDTPVCRFVIQDEELNSKLQALQLERVAEILQTETEETEIKKTKTKCTTQRVKGPWRNSSLSEPVDKEYSKEVLKLKANLFGALKNCAAKSKASGLPEFVGRLCAVWEAVKAESFSIGLQNTEVAMAFSMLCTELSQWVNIFLEHMESWFEKAKKTIMSNDAKAKTGIKRDLLTLLKEDAREEVKAEVDKIRLKVEAHLIKDDLHKNYIETYRPNLMNNMNKLQEQVTKEMVERLESVRESHYSSTQIRTFQTLLEKEQESKFRTLAENSKSTNVLLEDLKLEEEFESMWTNALSNFDFRHSDADDITPRVTKILRENLISRGLQKHINKVENVGKITQSCFTVYDEHFGYQSRIKQMFKDNNRQQRLEAHHVACEIIEDYNQFVLEKSSLLADFSESYISELLENVEQSLRAKPLETRSAFEVDLKVYLCSFACQDFQEIHDRYAKDGDLLDFINRYKKRSLGEFIYQYRKRDQCQRVAQAFTSMVFKPIALDYIYRPLGKHIMEEMLSQDNAQQYLSPPAFNRILLEELLEEDSFESFLEYLHSYENFSLKKIDEMVVAHLSESAILDEWRQEKLGHIVGKMALAVSKTAEGINGMLSDTKPLLEKVCQTLEQDVDMDFTMASLEWPVFSITTEWDRFVTYLFEALAEMRLALAQEFSQKVDINQLLEALPINTQDCLFNRVRGCEKQCPFCRTPCELGMMEHDVHRALLHRPKGMLSYTCDDSCRLSHTSCPADVAQDNLFLNKDTGGKSLAYRDYCTLYPDWSIFPEEPVSQTPIAYWRYVLVRFNERFAEEYEQQPAHLPEEWEKITKEEALESLKVALHTEQC
ncbi:interferon-induced very large GTPase 1 [Lampris incognitus]|uniref:interferon-induced very large GTPase 1 n=1 Tax=Lampris incognitus TaxID=2546036 RepID=UPI0024B59D64|nr:interferon-induced very large GTPase 1 [Lampris incognitus]